MVMEVRAVLATVMLAATSVLAGPATATATATSNHPTAAQIRRAVRGAERSPALWATVNICDTKQFPNTLGVRGQMPALGFGASLSIDIQVEFFDKTQNRFRPVPSATMKIPLGHVANGLQQGGATFTFQQHTGLLSANVEFTWTRAGKVLAHTTRRATAGHKNADFGSPPHFSAARCTIK
jgi:hypothetical protein